MSGNDEKVDHFMAVTGSNSREEATFFLESSGWDVETAVLTFMDGRDAEPEAAQDATGTQAPSDVAETSAPKPSITVKDDSKPSDSEQRWFTGGGVGSGQEVIAPPKGRKPVDDVFNAAMEMGARNATSEDVNPNAGMFTGGARTLAGGVVKAKEPPKQHVIRFYANEVFTVDDGPPRNIHDPQNKAFLDCIVRGEIPPEFLGENTPEGDADVQLMNIPEDYVPPAQPRVVAFQGTGNRLGASTSSAGPSQSQPPIAAISTVWEGPDASQPMTSLQLRLPDGSRMVAKFNHSQPVSDIRKFVASARPDLGSNYSMRAGFPAKPVADESLSLEAAGLLSATVILQ